MSEAPSDADRDRVRELLGREPQGAYEIAARDTTGDPIVIRNAPLLDDGTPMPTRYWLIGAEEARRIGQLEADGGVRAAEAAVDVDQLADAHARYAAERDAAIPAGHSGPRPSGGVGGTRTGVKCLHAHWAWHLAGGDDPVGRWIVAQLDHGNDSVSYTVGMDAVDIAGGGDSAAIPWGVRNLTRRWLSDHDPPDPASLTNALGTVDDHLDDLGRDHPSLAASRAVRFEGPAIGALARLEVGGDAPSELTLARSTAEEVFRIVATESATTRAHNPGLPFDHVDTVVAACCIVLAVMRRFHLDAVALAGPGVDG